MERFQEKRISESEQYSKEPESLNLWLLTTDIKPQFSNRMITNKFLAYF